MALQVSTKSWIIGHRKSCRTLIICFNNSSYFLIIFWDDGGKVHLKPNKKWCKWNFESMSVARSRTHKKKFARSLVNLLSQTNILVAFVFFPSFTLSCTRSLTSFGNGNASFFQQLDSSFLNNHCETYSQLFMKVDISLQHVPYFSLRLLYSKYTNDCLYWELMYLN